jgi:hypothetical protein
MQFGVGRATTSIVNSTQRIAKHSMRGDESEHSSEAWSVSDDWKKSTLD